MWPRTSWSLSSLTLNMVLGRASVISPSISIFSSLPMQRGAYMTGWSLAAQLAGAGNRLLAAANLAGVLRRLELGKQLAHLGPLGDVQFGGQFVPRQQRARRAVAPPDERRRQHFAGQAEVGLDCLLGREGTAAACREAVGDGEQRDVGGDRFGGAQVLVDAAGRKR